MRDIAQSIREREQAFEAQYKLDEELNFKIRARRDRFFGIWAAHELGLTAAETEAYATMITRLDLEVPGDDNMLDKVMSDLHGGGMIITKDVLIKALSDAKMEAQRSVMNEYPDALDMDHRL